MSRIVITGASDGIGRSTAIRLAKDGHSLVLFGRDEKRLKEVSVASSGSEYYAFDLNNWTSMKKTVGEVLAKGDVDILINNAGVWHKMGDLETIDQGKIKDVINTNLTSQIVLTQMFLEHIRDRENSFIVNVVSKSGVTAQTGQSVYSASKWGLRGFTDSLREDTKSDKVTIVGLYQSGTNTKLFEKAGDDFPVDSFTNPDDLANVIAFIIKQPPNLKIYEIKIDR